MTGSPEDAQGVKFCTCCGERPADSVHGVGPHERLMCKPCAKAWAWGWRAMISEIQTNIESLPAPSIETDP